MEQFPADNPNPVLLAAKDGTVLHSNEASGPLLHEWGVRVGEKLPSCIGDFVQRVIFLNSPEKMEVKAGKRIYLVAFYPSSEEGCVDIYGFDISDREEFKEKVQENEACEMANLELAEIVDIQTIQSLMDNFYKLAQIPMSLNDLKGNVLVGAGWQDICTEFHRVHPEACHHCVRSDTELSVGVYPGKFKLYKCKNNMWDIVTPILIDGQHVGNIFSGQFFLENEPLDYELFRSQARRYGFNEEEYIAALEKVPRLSKEAVNTGMSFLMMFANMFSQLSYSNIKLAQSLSERDTLLEALRESGENYRNLIETANEGIWILDSEFRTTYVNEKMAEMLGYSRKKMVDRFIWNFADEEGKTILKPHLEMRRQGINEIYEIKLTCKDESPLWALVSAKALFNKDGKFTGSMGMLTDISKRKEAESKLKKTLNNLENLVKERTAELREGLQLIKRK